MDNEVLSCPARSAALNSTEHCGKCSWQQGSPDCGKQRAKVIPIFPIVEMGGALRLQLATGLQHVSQSAEGNQVACRSALR